MYARIILEAGDVSPATLDLNPSQPATIGRARDNSLVARSDVISRLHAKIYFEETKWVIRNFGLNGTKVNNNKVNGAVDLLDNAIIQIGDIRFRFTTKVSDNTPFPMNSPIGLANSGVIVSSTTVMPSPGSVNYGSAVISAAIAHRSSVEPAAARDRDGKDSGIREKETVSKELTPKEGVKEATKEAVRESNGPKDKAGTKVHDMPFRQPFNGGQDLAETQLKVDELTALCRFMTAAVGVPDQHELIRHTLRTILNQTTATIAGYLSLDPDDPTPKVVLPDRAAVDSRLSRRLTERATAVRHAVWLYGDGNGFDPGDSLVSFTDAVCIPIATHTGELFAAVHVYRSGCSFSDRDVRFLEACAGFLAPSLEIHRSRRKLVAENSRLRGVAPLADELIGDSSSIANLRGQIARAAPQLSTVLIQGESGSGKELVAMALHRYSTRAEGPFVVVDCAATTPQTHPTQLFGYRKGAFSGADHDHPGFFEQADEGTLFLDEVGELPLECQAKLLRVIDGKAFRPVGAARDVKVDTRVIAATHRDLEQEVRAGRFRQELLYRLNVINLRVPSLRDHAEDIPELSRFFLERLSVQCRRPFKLSNSAMRKLQAFPWPGNVRQLRAVLESAAVMSETDLIDADGIPLSGVDPNSAATGGGGGFDRPISLNVDDLETWAIRKALQQTGGNVSRAARVLGMSRDTLHTKLKKKGIDREEAAESVAIQPSGDV